MPKTGGAQVRSPAAAGAIIIKIHQEHFMLEASAVSPWSQTQK